MDKQRFPNLTKVVLAVLEAKVETVIGKDAINEIKSPTIQKGLHKALMDAGARAEKRLVTDFPDNEIIIAIGQLPVHSLMGLNATLWQFYEDPTSEQLTNAVHEQVKLIVPPSIDEIKIGLVVSKYIHYFWEEATLIPEISEKLKTISIIRTEHNTAEIAKILHSLEDKIVALTEIDKKQTIIPNEVLSLGTLPIAPFFAHAQPLEMFWANRRKELDILFTFWTQRRIKVAGLIGLGGVGKSTLARKFFDRLYAEENKPGGFFWWSFYYQSSFDEFLNAALKYLTRDEFRAEPSPWARTQYFMDLISQDRFVFVLDGLEVMQFSHGESGEFGELQDKAFRNFLKLISVPDVHHSFFVVTSRYPLVDLEYAKDATYLELDVDYLSDEDGSEYLNRRGVFGDDESLRSISRDYGGHALSLSVLAGFIKSYYHGQLSNFKHFQITSVVDTNKIHHLLDSYYNKLNEFQKGFLQLIAVFRRPPTESAIKNVIGKSTEIQHNSPLRAISSLDKLKYWQMVNELQNTRLILSDGNEENTTYSMHPIVKEYFYSRLKDMPDKLEKILLAIKEYVANLEIPKELTTLEDLMPLFDTVYYSCQAGQYDYAVQLYHDRMSLGQWELGFRFGAYGYQISFLKEFFPNRDLTKSPLVSDSRAVPFLFHEIAYCYQKLGQPSEASYFWRRSAEFSMKSQDYKSAAIAFQGLVGTTDNLNDAQQTIDKGIECAKLANSKLWECNTFATKGRISFLLGDISVAEKAYNMANSIRWSENPDELGLFSILGVEYSEYLLARGDVFESLQKAMHNLAMCEDRRWQESIAYCKRFLGDVYIQTSDWDSASQYFISALDIARRLGIQSEIARNLLGLSKISIVSGEYDATLTDLNVALEIALQISSFPLQSDIHNGIAELHLNAQDLDSASRESQVALEISNRIGYAWGQARSLYLLGRSFLNRSRTVAKGYLEAAHKLQAQIFDPKVVLTQELLDSLTE